MKMILPSCAIIAVVAVFLSLPTVGDDSDRYEMCRDRARDVSRYYGAVPAEYENKGGALQGAIKGAAAGAALGWITDSDKSKAAKKGAALGALFGALKKANRNKKRRENASKRQRYEIELDDCMSARRD